MSKQAKTDSEEVSDEDSISITSTAPSEQREEYPVEAIIAEREVDGTIEYLVRWEGYPDERCTWEPQSSFQSPYTLFDWNTQKMRVSRGLAFACDVEALLDRVEKWVTASENRKSRRRAKRMRLGMSVAPMESNMDDESHNDRRQPKAGKEVQAESSQAPLNKGTSSKKDTIPARSRRSSEQTDGRHNLLKERSQISAGQEEDVVMNVVRNAPTAVMFHPQRQEDQSSDHPTSTVQTTLESPIKSSAETFRKSTDAAKKLPPIRDSHPDLHPQRQEVQSSNPSKITAKSLPVSPIKPSVGTLKRTTDSVKKLPTTRDSLPEKESSISNPRSNVPSTLPSKLTANTSRRGSATNSRPGMVGPSSPTREAHAPKQVQMGCSGRGPARLRLTNLKPSQTSSKRPSVTGAALLKNWSRNVKPRKSIAYQATLPKANERTQEKFSKLSVKRKYEKAGRNEPAPDIDKLVFIDLKPPTKKSSLSLPGLKIPAKTPFEMIQEGLNESTPNESVFVETPDSNTSEAIIEQSASNANKSDNQKPVSTEISPPNRAHNPLQVESVAEPLENVPAHSTQNPRKRPSLPFQAYRQQTASSQSAVPSNVVTPSTGPIPTKKTSPDKSLEYQEMPTLLQHSHDSEPQAPNPIIASMSTDREAEYSSIPNAKDAGAKALQSPPSVILPNSQKEPDLSIKTSVSELQKSYKHEIDPATTTSVFNAPPGSTTEPTTPAQAIRSAASSNTSDKKFSSIKTVTQLSSFDLTEAEKDLTSSRSNEDIFGTLLIGGPEPINLGSARFRVIDFSNKRLLLNIKVPPRQMHFWFQQICTAEDYRAYYHTVSQYFHPIFKSLERTLS